MKAIYLFIIMLFFSAAAFAQAGELDSSFNADGKVTTAISTIGNFAFSVKVQPDGKIIAGGYSYNGFDNDFTLVRYNTTGTLDNSFGTGGKVTTDFDSGDDVARSMAIQPDGKIVAAGFSDNGTDYKFALVRYNTDGTLDNEGFGTNGKVITAIGTLRDLAFSVAIQPDGKILAAGTTSNGPDFAFALVRYNSNGTLDTGFGADGKVITPFGSGDNAARSLVLQSDGKIVVAGESFNGINEDFALVRYNNDGTLDTGFGTDGKVTVAIGLGDDWLSSAAIQSDGKIIEAGHTYNAFNTDFALLRYNINGTLDSSFGIAGKIITSVGTGNDVGYSVAVQSDGKIIAAGSTSSGPNQYFALIRYNTDGTIDNTFGTDGKVTTVIGMGFAEAYSMAIQSDGRIVAAGYSLGDQGNEFALARYLSGLEVGIINFSSTTTPLLIYPNPLQPYEILEYTLTNNESLTIALYDVNGNLIKNFISNEERTAGAHKETLKIGALPSGNYLLTLSNGSQNQSVKLVKQ